MFRIIKRNAIVLAILAGGLVAAAKIEVLPPQLNLSDRGPGAEQSVTNVSYVEHRSNVGVLAAITFKVLPAPAANVEVKVSLEPEGTWYGCTADGAKITCRTASTPITLEEVVDLHVVASVG